MTEQHQPTDPIASALTQALVGAMLGSQAVTQPVMFQHQDGGWSTQEATITVPSALGGQCEVLARKGEFDDLIRSAVATITPEAMGEALQAEFVRRLVASIDSNRSTSWGNEGWFLRETRKIAVEATTKAVSTDDDLMDKLRSQIGMAVDRDAVEINVGLKPREGEG